MFCNRSQLWAPLFSSRWKNLGGSCARHDKLQWSDAIANARPCPMDVIKLQKIKFKKKKKRVHWHSHVTCHYCVKVRSSREFKTSVCNSWSWHAQPKKPETWLKPKTTDEHSELRGLFILFWVAFQIVHACCFKSQKASFKGAWANSRRAKKIKN